MLNLFQMRVAWPFGKKTARVCGPLAVIMFFLPSLAFASFSPPFMVLDNNSNITAGITSNVYFPMTYDTTVFNEGFVVSGPTTTVLTEGYYEVSISNNCDSTTATECRVCLQLDATPGNCFIEQRLYKASGFVGRLQPNQTKVFYLRAGQQVVVLGFTIDAVAPRFGGSDSSNFFSINFLYSSSTPISSDVTISDPNRDLYSGFIIFFILLFFVTWFFKKQ